MELNNDIYIVIPYSLYLSENLNIGRVNINETEVIMSYKNVNEIPSNILNSTLHTFNHFQALEYVNNDNW